MYISIYIEAEVWSPRTGQYNKHSIMQRARFTFHNQALTESESWNDEMQARSIIKIQLYLHTQTKSI